MVYRFSPSYANLVMGVLEEKWIWGTEGAQWTDCILYWGRYIDDCLMIWTGTAQTLEELCNFLNSNDMNIKFIYQSSRERIFFETWNSTFNTTQYRVNCIENLPHAILFFMHLVHIP